MSLLEQKTIGKEQVNKFSKLELDVEKDKEYKIEVIEDSTVYNKTVTGQIPKVYYLIS